jgi:hypothetical protein
MMTKILATFRCDPSIWQQFKALAELNNTNASALLLQFIDWYLAGNRLTDPAGNCIDRRASQGLDNISIELEQRLVSLLDDCIDEKLNHRLSCELKSLGERLELLEATVGFTAVSSKTQEKSLHPNQAVAQSQPPDLEKIRTRILNCLRVGQQSQLYKRVKAEFDRIIL